MRLARAERIDESMHATDAPMPEPRRRRRVPRNLLVMAAIISTLIVVNAIGLEYYRMPIGGRVRSDIHVWLKPTGYIGQSLGIVAFLGFALLWLYPLRKRIRFLARLGTLPRWLDVHIVLGVTVPLIGATHAAWQFRGLIGLGYLAMLAVALSGLIGKYLYLHIPRARDGAELSRDQIELRIGEIVAEIASETGVPAESIVRAADSATAKTPLRRLPVVGSLAADLTRRWVASRLAADLGLSPRDRRFAAIVRLFRRELSLRQQARGLELTRRLFRYWHVAHLPVAITALIAILLHVGVTVALGVTWF